MSAEVLRAIHEAAEDARRNADIAEHLLREHSRIMDAVMLSLDRIEKRLSESDSGILE